MWPAFYKHENLQTTIPFGNIAILGGGDTIECRDDL